MTVYLPKGGKTWWSDYRWKGERFRASTHQLNRTDAALVESKMKLAQRQQAGGIAVFDVNNTPRFQTWSDVYLKYQRRFVDRPDLIVTALSSVLEFWGAKPRKPKCHPKGTNTHRIPAPYHDLRLGHPIADPSWIMKFETWMERKGISGSTRNTYLSAMSGMYRVARDPQYRQVSQVPNNPFLEIRRSARVGRVVALPMPIVKAWMAFAPTHVRLAMAIASLAPKLRLKTILDLEWGSHVDADLTRITVYRHKTQRANAGRPQVTPIGEQLRDIFAAMRGTAKAGFVITYRGESVASIKRSTMTAAKAAGLTWGVQDGVTFHTIRHSIATFLAELGIGERLRMELLGHKELRTTQQYTHLAALTQVQPHAQLSDALAIKDIVLAPYTQRRRGKNKVGTALGNPAPNRRPRPAKVIKPKHRSLAMEKA